MNRMTRRRFLRAAAASGFAYAFARTPRVTYAQMTGDGSFADYKALVCVFLFGGNDSWNMVVPSSAAEYAEYAGSRQNLAVPQGALLPLQLAVPDASGWSFGLNPAMPGLAGLVQRRAGGDRRERRPARRPDDARAVPELFPCRCRRSCSRTTISRTSGIRSRAPRCPSRAGPAASPTCWRAGDEPEARAERLACRARRCIRPARLRAVHDGRGRPDAVLGSRHHGRGARPPPGVPERREGQLRHDVRARVRHGAAARARVRGARLAALARRSRAPLASGQSARPRSPASRLSCARSPSSSPFAQSAANVAADLLRRDRRVRHARRPDRRSAVALDAVSDALKRFDDAMQHLGISAESRRVHAVGLRAHAHVERRRHGSRVGRRAGRHRAAPWRAAASTASTRCCASARAAARIERTTSAAGGSFRRFRPISTRPRSARWFGVPEKPICRRSHRASTTSRPAISAS